MGVFGHPVFGYHDPRTDYHRYAREIRRRWPAPGEPPSDDLMELVEEAVGKCPHMLDLWLQRATLIQRCTEGGPYEKIDALASLEAAARIDPTCVEAHEAIAAFCEDVLGDLERAETAYLRAVDLHGGPWVFTGLARVLSKRGRHEEALAALSPEFCPYHAEPGIAEARRRLNNGDNEF